jgi:hypothetical protein
MQHRRHKHLTDERDYSAGMNEAAVTNPRGDPLDLAVAHDIAMVLNGDGPRPPIELMFRSFHDDAIGDGKYWSTEWRYEIATCVLPATLIAIRSKSASTCLVAFNWDEGQRERHGRFSQASLPNSRRPAASRQASVPHLEFVVTAQSTSRMVKCTILRSRDRHTILPDPILGPLAQLPNKP